MQNKFDFKNVNVRKVVYGVVSVVLALILWMYVTNVQGDLTTETFTGIKVVFEGENALRESKNLIVSNIGTTSVRATIEGTYYALSRLNAADITAVIDLSGISNSGTYTISYKINYPFGTDSSSLRVVNSTPQNISFRIDKLDTKSVEVRGRFTGSVAEGYSFGKMEFEPSTVKISGPQSILDQIDCAWVECARTGLDKTVTYDSDYVLLDADKEPVELDDNVELRSDTVSVTVPVTAIKTVDLKLKFFAGGGATEDNVKYVVEPATITLSGDAETLEGINSIILGEIDLAELAGGMSQTYTITIPNGTQIISGPKEATATIEIKGLVTRTFKVTNFTPKNVPTGYTPEIMNTSIDVILRGPADAISSVTAANIRAVVDLADYNMSADINTIPAKIEVDGVTTVGAIGEYEIFVGLKEVVEE
ncbi:MAG: hypothetical protein IKZ30_02125 [Oscillospiraceae bacterium]|nr:hypothetical protein [Oscillospiraceae bacterium]